MTPTPPTPPYPSPSRPLHNEEEDTDGKRKGVQVLSPMRRSNSSYWTHYTTSTSSSSNVSSGKFHSHSYKKLVNSEEVMSVKSLLAGVASAMDNPVVVLMVYFGLNLGITLYNKIILKLFHFKFPWLLTAIHAFLSYIGSSFLLRMYPNLLPANSPKTTPRENLILLAFSVLYTLNIAVSNISLNMVSLPFHQVVRSTNPAMTVVLERLIFGKRVKNKEVYVSLVMVILGVALATLGEYEFSSLGLFLTLLGVFLSALKGVTTHSLLVGSLKLHPLDLLWRMSGLAWVQCLCMGYLNGEVDGFKNYVARLPSYWTSLTTTAAAAAAGSTQSSSSLTSLLTVENMFIALLLNGVLAFWLNYISFSANKKVGALSMTVAGNVKQTLSIMLSVWIFGYVISTVNGIGITVTLIGGAWYSSIGLRRK
ncbi:UAA transporter [Chytridiales sp. JEL 0842]|nr:UAA transporter [Chytridiales sp. JEL 0842]